MHWHLEFIRGIKLGIEVEPHVCFGFVVVELLLVRLIVEYERGGVVTWLDE